MPAQATDDGFRIFAGRRPRGLLSAGRAQNGLSRRSTIQSFHAEGGLPVAGELALGGGYAWNRRIRSYAGLPTVEIRGPLWRVFAALLPR